VDVVVAGVHLHDAVDGPSRVGCERGGGGFFAAVPVTSVPDPAVQPGGTWPTTLAGLGWPRWNGITFAAVAALALLLEPELAIANPPNASPIAAAPAASGATILRLLKILCLRAILFIPWSERVVVLTLGPGCKTGV
jgi:hypothetical protein